MNLSALRRLLPASLAVCVLLGSPTSQSDQETGPIAWHSWNDALFAQARREHRYVLLDLEAVWCHWCHVMDRQTYDDPAVAKLIGAHYLAIKVDQDANPDLSNRYGDWGWPATIVFAPDGSEIVKRRGFIAPANMASLLEAIVDDPSPGPSVRPDTPITASADTQKGLALATADRDRLSAQFSAAFDTEHAGWGSGLKYIDAPAMDLALERAHAGDADATRMARATLDANLNLIDPVWGGVYQYSDEADWHSPHFEKIMSYQADDLRLYALAYAQWQDSRYLQAARAITRYLQNFLRSPQGAFYVSQDADLSAKTSGHDYYPLAESQRRALGLPRIDTHLYARENGWAIAALCRYADVSGDTAALDSAQAAARWAIMHRDLPGGGFRHDAKDRAGPYLGDSVAMVEAFLALYRSTGNRDWLDHASAALSFIDTHFSSPDGGFVTAEIPPRARGVFAQPVKLYEENVATVRLANLAWRYTGEARWKTVADDGMRYLAALAQNATGRFLPGVLLADRELSNEPAHITIVGAKNDPAAQSLHAAALRYPSEYLRVEWWDRSEGPLPNADVRYPQFSRAAAFACSSSTCSSPVFEANKLFAAVDRLAKPSGAAGAANASAATD